MRIRLMIFKRFAAIGLTIALILSLFACGGGGRTDPAALTDGGQAAPDLTLAVTRTAMAGGRLTAGLAVTGAEELYQLSCRLAYDPAVLRPVDSRRAALVTGDATFFSTLKADGYVPVAFTNHDGTPLPAAAGTLAEVEFEVIDPLSPVELSLITDPDYLIARDNTGTDLVIDLGVAQ